ncbi:MAG: DUF4350 domain-containing protein [Synechocystis sp.]|nr:DUF4350 domain-containing protein [Synechocystis sp.]
MASPLPLSRSRRLWLIAVTIAIVLVIGLFVLTPTSQSPQRQGSTYGRSPGDYGAWWTWMAQRNTPVQRWQKPIDQLDRLTEPATLLRIDPQAIVAGSSQSGRGTLSPQEYQWVSQGNRIVYLGRWARVSAAPFNQIVESEFGPVTIQGRRRATRVTTPLLSDDDGTIIWQEVQGDGEIIWVIPPFLAANAFQDQTANFQLLQTLMEPDHHQLWVDEYFHGYKDSETLAAETVGTIWRYFQQTPLFPLFVQILLLCGLVIGWGNRRFGRPHLPASPPPNNQQTYAHALAQVLEKGDRPEFVVQQLLQSATPPPGQLQATSRNDSSLVDPKLPQNEKELHLWLQQWRRNFSQNSPTSQGNEDQGSHGKTP